MSAKSQHTVAESREASPGTHPVWIRLGEVSSSLTTVIVLAAAGATIFGYAWVAVGWLRFYGIEVGVLPQALPVAPRDYNNQLLSWIGQGLDCYNCTFQGNSRFGSGLGLIAGASISLLVIPKENRTGRTTGALVAGALVGGRLTLSFTSDPAPFLVGSLIAAVLFLLVELWTRQRLPELPGIDYWKTTAPSYNPRARKPPSTEIV